MPYAVYGIRAPNAVFFVFFFVYTYSYSYSYSYSAELLNMEITISNRRFLSFVFFARIKRSILF